MQREAPDLSTILRDTMIGLVRQDSADLTGRQLATLLICYLEDGPHTVRGLAAHLQIGRGAITRIVDRLQELDLAQRRQDPRDRRNVIIARTPAGDAYMAELQAIMEAAAGD